MEFSAKDILEILPHKWPFLMVDKAYEVKPGISAKGVKNVSINDIVFQGHFPGDPILPGVLIIESLAQLVAIMYCSEFINDLQTQNISSEPDFNIADKVGYLLEVKTFKFKQIVRPGDILELFVQKRGSYGLMSLINCRASVNGVCVAEGSLSVSQKK